MHTTTFPVVKYREGKFIEENDDIALEYPLTIVLDGEEFATIVCTPSDLVDLVVGFLAAEGVIRYTEQIQSVTVNSSEGFAYVETKAKLSFSKERYLRRVIGSCCGKSRNFYFHNDAKTAKTVTSGLKITLNDCFEAMNELQRASTAFQKTGAVHNAALLSKDGVVAVRTDIGRHNALDKIYGYCLKHGVSLYDKYIAFSGRISSEVLLKVSKIGVGILLSKSAPTDLAIRLAEELNITAVGFIRRDSLNVYTHPERIVDMADQSITI